MTLLAKIVAAVIFLVVTFIVLTPLGAGLGERTGVLVALGGALLVFFFVVLAPTARRAWGRGFLLDGVILLAMPLLVIPLLGRAYSETTSEAISQNASQQAAQEIGAGIGVAMAFGAFSFVGLVLGIIFVMLGLVLALGGRREVVIVRN